MEKLLVLPLLFLLVFQSQALMEKKYIPASNVIEKMNNQEKEAEDFPTVLARPMPHIASYNWVTGPHLELRYSSQLRNLINDYRQSVKSRHPEVVRITIHPRSLFLKLAKL